MNNAGISIGAPAFDAPDDVWRDVMSVNVDGVWYCSRAVVAAWPSAAAARS